MQQAGSWAGLMFIGFLLLLAGFEGNIGRMLAVVFVPDALQVPGSFGSGTGA